MGRSTVATTGRTALHVGLGVFSLALGTGPVLAPRAVARAAGLSTRPGVLNVLRLIGVREIAVGTGLLRSRRPGWLWARVGQDVMDVPLAAAVTASKREPGRSRMAGVTAFLVGVTAVDVAAALRASRG